MNRKGIGGRPRKNKERLMVVKLRDAGFSFSEIQRRLGFNTRQYVRYLYETRELLSKDDA